MNTTFFGNSANGQGSAIFNSGTGTPASVTVTNSLFWENISFLPTGKPFWNADATASTNISYSMLELPTCALNNAGVGSLNCGAGMLFGIDPFFVDGYGGDLHLLISSPAIDAGTLAGAPLADFDGITRPQGLGVDMGAYETAGPRPMARQPIETTFDASLYPNPTPGAFTVQLNREVTGYAQVFDLQGRLVSSQSLNGTDRANFDLSSEVSGLYLVRIIDGDQIVTKKVTVGKP
jgi:hypothetical protein